MKKKICLQLPKKKCSIIVNLLKKVYRLSINLSIENLTELIPVINLNLELYLMKEKHFLQFAKKFSIITNLLKKVIDFR